MTTTPTWDAEADFVCVGSGIGALAGAITAHEYGLEPIILEKSNQVGGLTAYSYGEVWVAGNHLEEARGIEDSVDSGIRYVTWLGMGYADEELVRAYATNGPPVLGFFEEKAGVQWRIISGFSDYYWPKHDEARREGRFLEVDPFPAATLGEWQDKVRTSPHTPAGLTHDEMFGQGGAANMRNWDFSVMGARLENDERCLGSGFAATFVKAALDRRIPIHVDTPVEELITDGGRVVGARARHDGRDMFVRARRGVLVATSSYEWNPALTDSLDRRQPEFVSAIPPSITGDHIGFAGRIGAKLVHVPQRCNMGFHIPGEEHDGEPLWRIALTETGLPHAIVVNREGRRFADEAFYPAVGSAVEIVDGSDQSRPNLPCWVILDSQFGEKYPFGTILPGQELPEGLAVKADDLRELAWKTGIDADNLVAEVDHFNTHARSGTDPDFHRGERPWSHFMCGDVNNTPNPNLGPIERGPFYAVRLRMVGAGLPATGLAADVDGRVLGYDDQPIDGLYVAGNSMALRDVGAGYQSGIANGRGLIFGHLAARHAAGDPSRERASASHQTVPTGV